MASTPDGRGIGWWRRMAGCLRLVTPGFMGRRGDAVDQAGGGDGGDAGWAGVLVGGVGWRDFRFGDARFSWVDGGMRLIKPVVGMAATPDGKGYWLVASDGGVFSFGDARFSGSTGGMHLNKPVVGMASTPDGGGIGWWRRMAGFSPSVTPVFYGSPTTIDPSRAHRRHGVHVDRQRLLARVRQRAGVRVRRRGSAQPAWARHA